MTILSAVLMAWAFCLTAFVGLIMYRGQLTRHEIDEVFLNESVDREREIEHDDICRRVDRIDPLLKLAGAATAVISIIMIGLYVVELLPRVHF